MLMMIAVIVNEQSLDYGCAKSYFWGRHNISTMALRLGISNLCRID